MSAFQTQFHPTRNEQGELGRIVAYAKDYGDLSHHIGEYFLNVEINDFMFTIHAMKPRDLWRVSAAIEEAALSVSPPDGWLETPTAGAMQLAETDEGMQIQIAKAEPETPMFSDVADEMSDEEKARQVRLVNSAELLLDFCKRAISPPIAFLNNVDVYVKYIDDEALKLIRLIEPATPEDPYVAATYICEQLSKRKDHAADITGPMHPGVGLAEIDEAC